MQELAALVSDAGFSQVKRRRCSPSAFLLSQEQVLSMHTKAEAQT